MRKVIGVALSALLLVGMLSAVAAAQETDTEAVEPPAQIQEFLGELVEEGVINQEQADTLAERFTARFGERGRMRGPGGHHAETIAEVLDMTVDELRDVLADGGTIADVAGDLTDEVIDALVAEHQARLDQAVEDGRIDADTAAEKSAELEQRITDMVNGELPEGRAGFGPGRRGHRGFGGGFGPGPSEAPATGTSA